MRFESVTVWAVADNVVDRVLVCVVVGVREAVRVSVPEHVRVADRVRVAVDVRVPVVVAEGERVRVGVSVGVADVFFLLAQMGLKQTSPQTAQNV